MILRKFVVADDSIRSGFALAQDVDDGTAGQVRVGLDGLGDTLIGAVQVDALLDIQAAAVFAAFGNA